VAEIQEAEVMMYLNVWGAEEVYEQSLKQNEPQHRPEEKDAEKNKPLYRYLQNLWTGNEKKDKDNRQN
jgi:hypothetical protein